ncbi:MAG: hypothetical protein NTW95_01960 [Candidatus Aminicenantes bacterium]|nr:hypothetical protein [Candidatus Aminicenantes bacterium]
MVRVTITPGRQAASADSFFRAPSPYTAEPLPVICTKSHPPWIILRLISLISGNKANVTFSSSFSKTEKSPLCKKSCILPVNAGFVKFSREKTKAVETCNSGTKRATARGLISGNGVSSSPIPSPSAVPPLRKNGTSAPSCAAKAFMALAGIFRLK